MVRLPLIARSISLLLLMALPILNAEAQQYAGSGRSLEQPSGTAMRVVDGRPQAPVGPGYFTVVGEVERSGVYLSDEPSVPLPMLIKAAGGITSRSQVSVKILSGARIATQVAYNPNSTELIRPGEILVVGCQGVTIRTQFETINPGRPEPPASIPIVCLGLVDRPVVIPLNPEIATVPSLVAALMQPAELANQIQRIDPAGRAGRPELSPGSIVIFPKSAIDPIRLRLAEELPPAVSLATALGPKQESTSPPAEASAPQKTADAFPVPPGYVVREFQGPPALPAPGQSMNVVSPPGPMDSFNEPVVLEDVLASPNPSPVIPNLQPVAPLLPPASSAVQTADNLRPVLEDRSTLKTVSAEPEPTLADPLPTTVESQPVLAMAPAPPVESPVVTTPHETVQAGQDDQEEADDTISGSPHQGSSGVLPIAVTVGILTILCLVGCIVWSRYEHLAFHRETQGNAQPELVSAARAPVQRQGVRSALSDVIDQTLPVVEEPVPMPEAVQLHGSSTAHEKLILHPAHPAVPTPQFLRRQSRQPVAHVNASDERQLREQLRSAIAHAAPAAPQTSDYDVVQPMQSSTPSAMGPLERALRSLARESRS